MRGDKDMNMIRHYFHSGNSKIIRFGDLSKEVLAGILHVARKHFSPVLRRPDYVVADVVNARTC